MREFIITEEFFKAIAEKGKMFSRIWFFWLANNVDEILENDFLEQQKEKLLDKLDSKEVEEIYLYGIEFLKDFKIVEKKSKKKLSITSEQKELSEKVINYLNEQSGSFFSNKLGGNMELIVSRIKEGYTFSEFKLVIDRKVKDWKGTDWQKYLRPITLFAKTKFENYLNQNDESTKNKFGKFSDSVAKAKAIIGIHKD
jgi:uncharacterized phage protein (TIGR02220 family)